MKSKKPRRAGAANKCFHCQNAVPDNNGHGCSWSRSFEPVPGWTAEPSKVRSCGCEPTETWHITACPEFIPDGIPQYDPRISVRCIETGVEYDSLSAAARAVGGGSGSAISDAIRRGQPCAYGFHWEIVRGEKV